MTALYVLLAALAIPLLYILFLWLCSCFVDMRKDYEKDSAFYRHLLYGATAIGVWLLRIKVEIRGTEKLPAGQRLLFVCNHRSKFDPILKWHVLKDYKMSFISKPENFKVFIFGKFIKRCCFLAIDRESPLKAIRTINKAANNIKAGTVSVGVYPEGKRGYEQQLLPFHNGVLMVAKKAKCPVAVLTVTGTEQIHKNAPFRRSNVVITVCELIPVEVVCQSTSEALGDQCREIMERHFNTEKGKLKDENDLCVV